MPYPLTSDGFIDERFIFSFVVGTLKLPMAVLDELTLEQFSWLYEHHMQTKKEEYELLAHVVSVGYTRTQTKKRIKLFADEGKKQNRVGKITKDEKAAKLAQLNAIFAKK